MTDSIHYDVEGPWTDLQIAFVDAYFASGGNKSKAIRLAGSKTASPDAAGFRMSTVPHVAKAIKKESPKRLKALSDQFSVEVLFQIKSWVLADRSRAFNDDLTPKHQSEWPEELRPLLIGVSAQSSADGTIIRQPKFAAPDSIANLFLKVLDLIGSRFDAFPEILADPVEVAKVKELREAVFERVQAALVLQKKLDESQES